MTRPVTHLWRLIKWGRTLARHGALQGIERDPLTPPNVRRMCRLARIGARVPKDVDYAAALQEIGPAAIKLGQALATRPDLVGEVAAANLLQLQDDLPPEPFPKIRAAIGRSECDIPEAARMPPYHVDFTGRRRVPRAGARRSTVSGA